ncbi:MAG TPA: hypothetical protein VN950_05235 [Terriglobales bacterium]|nr:hypothetical protein [Terriglobales bacterium]
MSPNRDQKKKTQHTPQEGPAITAPKEIAASVGINHKPEDQHKQGTPSAALSWWILVTGIAVAVIYALQLQAMLASNKLTHDALVIGQRPWLGIEPNPTVEVDGARWKIAFTVKNYGISPALHSAFSSEPDNAPITSDVSKAKIEWACSRGEELTRHPEGHGYTIFPGTSQTQDITIGGPSDTALYLLGCLTYLDEFGVVLHHTQFCETARAPVREGSQLTPCFGGQEAD